MRTMAILTRMFAAVSIPTTRTSRTASLLLRVAPCLALLGVTSTAVAQQQPPPGQWGMRASTLQPLSELAVAELNGKLYLMGGYPASRVTVRTVQVYDIATNTWSYGPDLPMPNNHGMPASVNGKIYLIGGQTQADDPPGTNSYVNTVYELDPAVGQWVTKAPMPTARSSGAAVVLDGKIYVAGGRLPRGSDFAVFDPVANTWEVLPNLPTQRNHFPGAAINGRVHYVGGRQGNGLSPEMTTAHEVFDPQTRTWTTAAPMLRARSGMNAVMARGLFHVWGGEGPAGMFPDHDYYNPVTNTWTELPDMPIPVHGITGSAFVNGLIWATGGGTGIGGSSGSTLNQVYRPAVGNGLRFVPLTPCRALDTRSTTKIEMNETRAVAFAGTCGVPADARAISANFTVVDYESDGYLSLYEEQGFPSRPISSINFGSGEWALANAAIVPLRTGAALTAFAANSSVHLVVDVNGYFVASGGTGANSALAFQAVTPCRSSDTRDAGGPLQANTSREFTIGGTCGVPASAAAVSANFTAVDFPGDGYLSIYTESGNPPRPISTLNFSPGQWALANAAILPLRTDGGLTVFSANSPSNVIVDVNGYFDQNASLSFYPVTPCRAWDTRESGGAIAANGFRAFTMTGQCGVPAGARAVSVNVTTTGFADSGFLSAYTELSTLPRAISTMNFTSGQWALANAAIVPLRTDGGLTIFSGNTPAHVILDVNGYFAE